MPSTLKCTNCGGDLKFTPQLQKWKCEWCDEIHTKEDLEDQIEAADEAADHAAQVAPPPVGKREVTDDGVTITYKCDYCGAEVITSEGTMQTFCVYCQRPVTILSQVSGEFKPSAVLPFTHTKEDAISQFKNFLKGKRFLPDSYCADKNVEKLTGVYIPFWLFDGIMHFDYSGEGDVVTVFRQGDFEVTRTDTFRIVRKGSLGVENVPVDASLKTPDDIMDSIEPFTFSELRKFATPYLSGFLAERFDVSQEDSQGRAEQRMAGSVDKKISASLGRYNRVRTQRDDKSARNVTAKYALLPVWLLYSFFQEEKYLFAMNGQTGKMLGNLPMDKGKMAKFGLLVFAISGVGSALLGLLLRYLGII